MPWKIVNLDYACERPHLHLKDPAQPIHLRAYLAEERVEIALGDDEPEACPVRATVTPETVSVAATRFEPLHVKILASILGSLDVEPQERDTALAWMSERMERKAFGAHGRDGWLTGNVEAFAPPTGWPYDLTDEALVDSIRDPSELPSARRQALHREARRRGLRVERAEVPAPSVPALRGLAPEIHRRPKPQR
jgi:hypothetical protein